MRSDQVNESNKYEESKFYIPVQEYTGKEYPANEKKERWEYIEEHKKEIEDKAIEWVKKTFGLDVKINHMYPTNGAAIATAEWLSDSNLKIKVVLGLDEKKGLVTGVNPSMDAENNIMSYIVYRVYQEEIDRLDVFLEEFSKRENLYGLTDEYINNMGSFASTDSNYYYIGASHLRYPKTYTTFLDNPSVSSIELKETFEEEYEKDKNNGIENDQFYGVNFVISLYSSNNKIDESLFKVLEESFVKETYLPDFNYAFILSENSIDTRTDRANDISYPDAPTETGFIRIAKGNK